MEKKQTSLWMYIPYCVPMLVAIFGSQLVFFNSSIIGYGFLALLAAIVVLEPILGNDDDEWEWKYPNIFVGMMYLYAIGTFVTFLSFMWVMGHANNGGDLFSMAAGIQAISGVDIIPLHAEDGLKEYLVATLIMGIVVSIGTVSIGHELCHRTHEPLSIFFARAMGTLSLFSYYAVEHPFGHHLTAGTPRDSSTALRGETVAQFAKRTFKQDYEIAWDIEKSRLDALDLPLWSSHNRLLRGYAAELAVVVTIAATTGFIGLFFFSLSVILGHWNYKVGVYGQHYGITRAPDERLDIHHSWGCTNRVTNWFVDGIGRHADHHEVPEREFWNLEAHLEGPQFAKGYFASMAAASIPSQWNKMTIPKLIEWDEKWASPKEKVLAMEANEKSGIPELIEHAKKQRVELIEAGLIAA